MAPPSKHLWFGRGIGLRFALATAMLSGLAVLLVGCIYWSLLLRQMDANAELSLQKDVAAEAARLGGILNGIGDTIQALSENSLFASALVDSAGRETYLAPFLSGFRRIQHIPIDIIFTDFAGHRIATNGALDLTSEELGWLLSAIAGGTRQAVLRTDGAGRYILAAEMLSYDRTKTPEGCLVYRLRLADLHLTEHGSQEEAPDGLEQSKRRALIPASTIFQSLNLEASVSVIRAKAMQDLHHALAGLIAAALAVMLLVLLLSRVAGQHLTLSLRSLDRLARSVARDGLKQERVQIDSQDEVGSLANSFNRMMDFLSHAYEDLEAKVVARTEDLQQALLLMDRSEKRYRSLFSDAKAAMLLVDPYDGSIMDTNLAAADFYGYSPERLKTMNISDINQLAPEEVQREMDAARQASRNHFFFRHRLASGEIRDVEVHAGTVEIDGKELLFSIIHDITDRLRLEAERKTLVQAIAQSPVSIVITDIKGDIEYVNPAFNNITGYSNAEIIGENTRILKSGKTTTQEYAEMWATLISGNSWTGTFYNRRKDGSYYWENTQISPVIDDSGQISHFVGIKENITRQMQDEQRLRQLLSEQKAMLENDLVGIVKVKDRLITWTNPAFDTMLGFDPGELTGQPTRLLYPSDGAYDAFGTQAYPVMNDGKVFRWQMELIRKDGGIISVDVSGDILDAELGTSLWGFLDITDRVRLANELKELSRTDVLTGLPNRRAFGETVQAEFHRSQRFFSSAALLMIDIDHFKVINDSHGHEAGDRALQALAKTLGSMARNTDMACRWGGEEFVFLLVGTDLSGAAETAERIREAVAQLEVDWSTGSFHFTVSIGAAIFAPTDRDWTESLQRADRAMYQAKNGGRNRVVASTIAVEKLN